MLLCWSQDPLKRPSFRKLVERAELLLSENTKNVRKLCTNVRLNTTTDILFDHIVCVCVAGVPEPEQCACPSTAAEGALTEAELRLQHHRPHPASAAQHRRRLPGLRHCLRHTHTHTYTPSCLPTSSTMLHSPVLCSRSLALSLTHTHTHTHTHIQCRPALASLHPFVV